MCNQCVTVEKNCVTSASPLIDNPIQTSVPSTNLVASVLPNNLFNTRVASKPTVKTQKTYLTLLPHDVFELVGETRAGDQNMPQKQRGIQNLHYQEPQQRTQGVHGFQSPSAIV